MSLYDWKADNFSVHMYYTFFCVCIIIFFFLVSGFLTPKPTQPDGQLDFFSKFLTPLSAPPYTFYKKIFFRLLFRIFGSLDGLFWDFVSIFPRVLGSRKTIPLSFLIYHGSKDLKVLMPFVLKTMAERRVTSGLFLPFYQWVTARVILLQLVQL